LREGLKNIRAWPLLFSLGFTKEVCPPFLDDFIMMITRAKCERGDMVSCRIFHELGGEIQNPDGTPAIIPDDDGLIHS
jgi:hypothetical protein